MKTEDAKSIIELIRDAPVGDITVVSFVLLPILLAAWLFLLNSVSALDQHPNLKSYSIAVLFLIYVVGVWIMKSSESSRSRRLRAAKHIRNRLERRGNRLGSFDYLRRTVNSEYTDELFFQLIEDFPDDFRRAIIKGGKPGLALNDPVEG